MEKTKADKFLDEFQDRYFLNSLEKKERQELRDFIISQNKDLLEACKTLIENIDQDILIKIIDDYNPIENNFFGAQIVHNIIAAINKAEN